MRKSITAVVVGLIIGVASSAAGASVAICTEEAGDGNNTGAYWTHTGGGNSYEVERDLRQTLRNQGERVATCSSFTAPRGYWAVVHNNRHEGRLILGIGFGLQSSSQAVELALRNLSGRDWLWGERHGHSVVASGSF